MRVVCQGLCKKGGRHRLAGMLIRRNLSERPTAKNMSRQLPSLRKAAAILWLWRLTQPMEPLDDIRRADRLPVRRREGVEGQAGLQITLEALDGRWIGLGILLAESRCHLVQDQGTYLGAFRCGS